MDEAVEVGTEDEDGGVWRATLATLVLVRGILAGGWLGIPETPWMGEADVPGLADPEVFLTAALFLVRGILGGGSSRSVPREGEAGEEGCKEEGPGR